MTDNMELKNVFYALVIPFLIFFGSFALFIYPNRVMMHPHALCDAAAAMLPANFGAPLAIIRNWSFAVFYVMAEMWGSVVASLLFWGFANEVTTVEEAKKYCTSKVLKFWKDAIVCRAKANFFIRPQQTLSLALEPTLLSFSPGST
jgi:ATP/ADP translocase